MLSRPIDNLGRVVIPKEIRKALNWRKKDPIGITTQGKNVILGKLEDICSLCHDQTDLVALPNGSMVCSSCLKVVVAIAQTHEDSHL